jgi:hypothetical protein
MSCIGRKSTVKTSALDVTVICRHDECMSPTVNHTVFMLVRTTRAWLDLAPKERFAWLGEVVAPILGRHPAVSMRFFDSEAFTARFSDVVMWETADILQYQAVVEELRETNFWDGYFEVVEIISSIENAFELHYGENPVASR